MMSWQLKLIFQIKYNGTKKTGDAGFRYSSGSN
jgi:hypothetical protein